MFTDYFGNWFATWFGDTEDEEPPTISTGDGGGSGKAAPFDAWSRPDPYFAVEKPTMSVMDIVRLAHGAHLI